MLSIPGFSDPMSSLSHLSGAVVFAILSVPLMSRGRGDALRVVSLAVFAFSCVLLLSLSGVYHLLTRDGSRYRQAFPTVKIISPDTHP